MAIYFHTKNDITFYHVSIDLLLTNSVGTESVPTELMR